MGCGASSSGGAAGRYAAAEKEEDGEPQTRQPCVSKAAWGDTDSGLKRGASKQSTRSTLADDDEDEDTASDEKDSWGQLEEPVSPSSDWGMPANIPLPMVSVVAPPAGTEDALPQLPTWDLPSPDASWDHRGMRALWGMPEDSVTLSNGSSLNIAAAKIALKSKTSEDA
jgi:hypothetical protein